MGIFEALILGIVQGLTEFIPVSSSGHLVLVPFVVGWKQPPVAFDVALHLGTLVALLIFFRREIAFLARSLRRPDPVGRHLLAMLAIGTVPAIIVGVALNGPVERVFERPVVVSFLLGITGWALLFGESTAQERAGKTRGEDTIGAGDAGLIGAAQAIAVLPGISRSGSTVVAGLARGLDRKTAVRFSFLLAIPIIAGAAAVKLPDMAKEGAHGLAGALTVGVIAAIVFGYVGIRAFMGAIERWGLRPFAYYCFVAMTGGLLAALARG